MTIDERKRDEGREEGVLTTSIMLPEKRRKRRRMVAIKMGGGERKCQTSRQSGEGFTQKGKNRL